jgi:hypothetical protein
MWSWHRAAAVCHALGGLFGFVVLPWPLLAAMLGVVAAYVLATEYAKRWFWNASRQAAEAA